MKIQEVIDAILREIPVPPIENTVDTLKSGDPGAEVRGIVTTFIATRAVLQRARKLRANLVITHEPTYYNHRDLPELAGDPVYESKRKFIEASGIAVWRFHDYWHKHRPDGILWGLVRKMGWEKHQDRDRQNFFRIPPVSLRALAGRLKRKLALASFRVAGDPRMKCSGVATSLGCVSWKEHWKELGRDDTDVLICGESHEWEACEYVRDSVPAGKKKAMIVLGHCNSEEPGMEYLAEWLRPRVPGVRVTFVPAGDPFWYA